MESMTYVAHLLYNPINGDITKRLTGESAIKCVNRNGKPHLYVLYKGKRMAAHKAAWALVTGELPESDARIRFMDDDPTNIKAVNLTYGRGRLSSYLKGVHYVIEPLSEILHKFTVSSYQGDLIHWLGKFQTYAEAEAFIEELKRPPFRFTLTITDKNLFGVANGEKFSHTVKNKDEALAIAQSVLMGL